EGAAGGPVGLIDADVPEEGVGGVAHQQQIAGLGHVAVVIDPVRRDRGLVERKRRVDHDAATPNPERRDVQSLQRVFVLCDDRQAGISRQPDKDAPVSAADNVPDHAWRGRVQSVERAFALLDAIAAGSPRGSTVAELALACGINRATAWRLLATLEGRSLVDRDPATSRYQIGYTVARLAAAAGVDGLVRRAHH